MTFSDLVAYFTYNKHFRCILRSSSSFSATRPVDARSVYDIESLRLIDFNRLLCDWTFD